MNYISKIIKNGQIDEIIKELNTINRIICFYITLLKLDNLDRKKKIEKEIKNLFSIKHKLLQALQVFDNEKLSKKKKQNIEIKKKGV